VKGRRLTKLSLAIYEAGQENQSREKKFTPPLRRGDWEMIKKKTPCGIFGI